jgi:thioredoxin-related protein
LKERFGDVGLRILAVNAWNESEERVQGFVDSKDINYRVLLNGSQVAREYGIRGIPTSFLIDANGRIVKKQIGYSPALETALRERIKALLKQ